MEGAKVCPAMVGICVVGVFVGTKEVGKAVGEFEGLFEGLKVAGLAVGEA